MRPAAATLLLAALAWGCSRDRDLLGEYSNASFLSVEVGPVPGTTGTRGTPTVCVGSLQLDSVEDGRLRGRFARRECNLGPGLASEVQGEVTGTVLPDGTATLTFSQPPLATSQAVRTSCGCPDLREAGGPTRAESTRGRSRSARASG